MEVDLIRHPDCYNYRSWSEYMQGPGQSAVLELLRFNSINDYIQQGLNATARNRHRHSIKKGFITRVLSWAERNDFREDIYQVNTSSPVRQGREMAASYLEFPKEITGNDPCFYHRSYFLGCFNPDSRLVAYITVNVCGEMAASSQILGHGDFLKEGVMINAWVKFVEICMLNQLRYIIYSRWNDGWRGLQYWKHSVGMRPASVCEKMDGTPPVDPG